MPFFYIVIGSIVFVVGGLKLIDWLSKTPDKPLLSHKELSHKELLAEQLERLQSRKLNDEKYHIRLKNICAEKQKETEEWAEHIRSHFKLGIVKFDDHTMEHNGEHFPFNNIIISHLALKFDRTIVVGSPGYVSKTAEIITEIQQYENKMDT